MIDMPIAEGHLPAYRRCEVSCGGVGSRSAAVGCWTERIVLIISSSEVASYRLAYSFGGFGQDEITAG